MLIDISLRISIAEDVNCGRLIAILAIGIAYECAVLFQTGNRIIDPVECIPKTLGAFSLNDRKPTRELPLPQEAKKLCNYQQDRDWWEWRDALASLINIGAIGKSRRDLLGRQRRKRPMTKEGTSST